MTYGQKIANYSEPTAYNHPQNIRALADELKAVKELLPVILERLAKVEADIKNTLFSDADPKAAETGKTKK